MTGPAWTDEERESLVNTARETGQRRLLEIRAAADDLATAIDSSARAAREIAAAVASRSMSVDDASARLAALRRAAGAHQLSARSLAGFESSAARMAEDPSYLLEKYDFGGGILPA